MIKRLFFILFCLITTSFAKRFDDSEIKHIAYPSWFNDSPFLDISEVLDNAKSNGKKGIILKGSDSKVVQLTKPAILVQYTEQVRWLL